MPLGQKLSEARQQQGLTEAQASAETCIPLAIIRSLEADDYSIFEGAIYAKNFLKTYARYLDLNISEIFVKFDELTSPDSGTIFKANRQQLEDTAPPRTVQRSRSPLILAPVLMGICGFLCYSLFSLFTGGSLPFAPTIPESESSAATPAASSPTYKPASVSRIATQPLEVAEPEGAPAGTEGAYVDDFHTSSRTVILQIPDGSSTTLAEVLP